MSFLFIFRRSYIILNFLGSQSCYTTYKLVDVSKDQQRSVLSYSPLSWSTMTWAQYFEAFLERFMLCNLKDKMQDQLNHLEQGYMSIIEYKTHFYALSTYSIASISTQLERIHKFEKGLEGTYQLDTAQMLFQGLHFRALLSMPS